MSAKGQAANKRDPAVDAWARLDTMLLEHRYMRFSLDTNRDWDDATKRQWRAVIYMESGRILARAVGATRDGTMIALLEEMEK